MLRRIHLLRKLQARDDHLPGRFGEVGGGPAGPFGPLLPLLVVQLLDLAVCEVARLGPLLVELAHHGPDQALERSLGREHLHHAAAALYLAVRALLHVVRAQPLPCDGGKARYASASGSASSATSAALGQRPRSMSQATWYMSRAVAASFARNTRCLAIIRCACASLVKWMPVLYGPL